METRVPWGIPVATSRSVERVKRRVVVAAVAGGMALLLLVPIVMQIFILAV